MEMELTSLLIASLILINKNLKILIYKSFITSRLIIHLD